MGLWADTTAYLMQKSAPHTVRYGEALHFAGSDLPGPEQIRVPTRHGFVTCLLYRPADGGDRPPVYVHLHGGAFVMRYPQMDDFFARFVAAECGAVVLLVDYDVAPQVRYPVAQHQAYDVALWAATHGYDLAADAGRVALGGFSAGGNLAASAALQARDDGRFQPVLQLLGVPALDVASPIRPARGSMVTPRLQRLVRRTYFKDATRRSESYASPLLADDLAGTAPALVLTAERDALREDGDAYALRLTFAGVHAVHHVVPDADHYFLDGPRAQALGTLELVANTLRERFIETSRT